MIKKMRHLISVSNDSKKFFSSLKQFTGTKQRLCPNINGKFDRAAAEEFVNFIKGLQNVTIGHSEVTTLKQMLSQNSNACGYIAPDMVERALLKLKSGKCDTSSINSSVLKLLGPSFITFLARYFNSMISHGLGPYSMSQSVLNPLLKANKK